MAEIDMTIRRTSRGAMLLSQELSEMTANLPVKSYETLLEENEEESVVVSMKHVMEHRTSGELMKNKEESVVVSMKHVMEHRTSGELMKNKEESVVVSMKHVMEHRTSGELMKNKEESVVVSMKHVMEHRTSGELMQAMRETKRDLAHLILESEREINNKSLESLDRMLESRGEKREQIVEVSSESELKTPKGSSRMKQKIRGVTSDLNRSRIRIAFARKIAYEQGQKDWNALAENNFLYVRAIVKELKRRELESLARKLQAKLEELKRLHQEYVLAKAKEQQESRVARQRVKKEQRELLRLPRLQRSPSKHSPASAMKASHDKVQRLLCRHHSNDQWREVQEVALATNFTRSYTFSYFPALARKNVETEEEDNGSKSTLRSRSSKRK
ncbi:predicted protein [Nematostella vectensis]|uniref:Uncharacterized protein n=1 Tax=Nematostella vectensis TaxID=45351 RepID=A7SHL0_NEMVE|nr:predicted protein [Nematostella vectensis]|eukprot:XP_001628881.1 predicted protein [Nematostella vectensis]